MSKKGWMPLEEAIQHVMRVRGCSRHKAREELAKHARDGKLGYKAVLTKEPPMKSLTPDEAAKKLDEDPTEVFLSLADFRIYGDFSPAEMLGELRSGRLIASATDAVMFKAKVGGSTNAADFHVTAKAVLDWMTNPKTPQHLLAKWKRGVERRPS